MEFNVVEKDGKAYLELPCLPGDDVYSVGPYFSINSSGDIEVIHKIYTYQYSSVRDIVRDLGDFGVRQFTTLEEAEELKKKLENKRIKEDV